MIYNMKAVLSEASWRVSPDILWQKNLPGPCQDLMEVCSCSGYLCTSPDPQSVYSVFSILAFVFPFLQFPSPPDKVIPSQEEIGYQAT